MAVQLVREGRCNPGIESVDAAVRKVLRGEDGMSMRQIGRVSLTHEDAVMLGLTTLRHTAHTMTSTQSAACQTCGTSRRYGWL